MRAALPADAGREGGFTLAEMLVGLGVLALAALLLAQGMARIGLGEAFAARAEGGVDAVVLAQTTLRERIEPMLPVKDIQTAGASIDAHGSAESFDFVTTVPLREAPDAPRHYRLLRSPSGDILLYSLSTLDAVADPHDPMAQGWRAERLIAGTAALSLAYYGPGLEGGAPVWQASWPAHPALPLLVRIAVRFPEGDTRRWPDLVIHPRAACSGANPCGGRS